MMLNIGIHLDIKGMQCIRHLSALKYEPLEHVFDVYLVQSQL